MDSIVAQFCYTNRNVLTFENVMPFFKIMLISENRELNTVTNDKDVRDTVKCKKNNAYQSRTWYVYRIFRLNIDMPIVQGYTVVAGQNICCTKIAQRKSKKKKQNSKRWINNKLQEYTLVARGTFGEKRMVIYL